MYFNIVQMFQQQRERWKIKIGAKIKYKHIDKPN